MFERLSKYFIFYVIPFLLKGLDLVVTYIVLEFVDTANEGNPFIAWLINSNPLKASLIILSCTVFIGYLLDRSWERVVAKRGSEKFFVLCFVLCYALLVYPIVNNMLILWLNVF